MTSTNMLPSPSSTYASWDSNVSPAIHFISTDASPETRLADWGYVDQGGRWRRVLNPLDDASCRLGKVTPLRLSAPRSEYITGKQQKGFTDPVIVLSKPGHATVLEPDVFALNLNPGKKAHLEIPESHARSSQLGLMIYPLPNTFTTAFIAGPEVFSRQLHISDTVLWAWFRANEKALYRAARRMMKYYPPMDNSNVLSFATTEFATECFRTLFIRTDANPSPVALGLRRKGDSGPGVWNLIEMQRATTVVSGGFGSVPNGTEWTVGSDGLTVQMPSKLRNIFRRGCFCRSCDGELKALEPVPPPFKEKTETSKEGELAKG